MADEDTLEIDEGAAEAPSPVQEPEAPAYDWGDYKDEPWAQRFKTPADLAQSVEQGTQKITQQSQEIADYKARLAEYEASQTPEEPWTPLAGSAAPPNVDPEFYGRVEAEYRRNPEGTFRELVEGGPQYAAYAKMVYDAMCGPNREYEFEAQRLYQQILQEQQEAKWQTMLEEKVNEAFGQVKPISQHVALSMANAGVDLARVAAPDFEEYMPRITEAENALLARSEGKQSYFADVRDDPQAMAERLVLMRDQFWAADQRVAASAPKPAATAKPTARRGVIGANSSERPDASDRETMLRESMKNTKVRDIV